MCMLGVWEMILTNGNSQGRFAATNGLFTGRALGCAGMEISTSTVNWLAEETEIREASRFAQDYGV